MALATRRQFLQTTAAAGTSLLLPGTRASGNFQNASERVRVAVVGLNGRGQSHMKGWMGQDNVEIASVVEVDDKVLSRALGFLEKETGKAPKGIVDIRDVLDDKNIDAISIAAPNHWHSLMTIWGAQAGKHVYVEKPMSHDVGEGRVAVAAQEKYGVVVQHGTQRRSDARVAGLHKAIKEGKFGRLKISYGYCCKPRGGIGFKEVTAPPENLNWDLWRGPADIKEYHDNYVHYNWHWFWKSGNGDLNNQGTHQLDVARWAIDDDQTHPVSAMALGGRFQWDDQGETPNTMFAMAEYPNGQQVFFNVRNVNYKGYQHQVQNEYYFEDGGRVDGDGVKSGEYLYYPPGGGQPEKIDLEPGDVTPGGNWGSFIAAVRANDPTMANGNVYDAHYGCVLGHLMNNSYRLGEQVPFNEKAGRFGDNKDAAEHFGRVHEIMRDGVGIPEDGAQYTVGPTLTFDPKTERHTGDFADAANVLLKDTNRTGFEVPEAAKV